jgi:hypothetical protein
MPALDNGWMKIDTTSGSGSTAIAVVVSERNTGRSVTRTATIVGTNAHGVEATAEIIQRPAPLFITLDHFENEKLVVLDEIPVGGGLYYLVGYSNVDFLTISELNNTYTDVDGVSGYVWTHGFTLIDGENQSHTINLESSISYGTDVQYTFRIPITFNSNSGDARDITFEVSDDGDTQNTIIINQSGVPN